VNKFLKGTITSCLIIPCSFCLCGCGKEDAAKMENWDGTIAEVSEAEDGVISIETAEELAGLAKSVNEGTTYNGYTIKLTRDMNLANKEWTPIGFGSLNYIGEIDSNGGAFFDGVFDGGGHTIYNLKITSFSKGGQGSADASAGVGFIGCNTGTIKDLTIDGAAVNGNHYVGVLTGFNLNAEITNCHVVNAKVNCLYKNDDDSGDKSGAIAGHFARGLYENDVATLNGCSVKDTIIKADRDAGQVIGCISNGASQSGNTAENTIVGWNESGNTSGKSNTNITNNIVGRVA
jgi:hypothetical protein